VLLALLVMLLTSGSCCFCCRYGCRCCASLTDSDIGELVVPEEETTFERLFEYECLLEKWCAKSLFS
jgi:hypothetical protein